MCNIYNTLYNIIYILLYILASIFILIYTLTHIYRERQIERERERLNYYFKELSHVTVGLKSLKFAEHASKLETQRRVDVAVGV